MIVRNQPVILDRDLARLYEVPTIRFNEAVKRNADRFPEDFGFRLSPEEWAAVKQELPAVQGGARVEDARPNSSQIAMSSAKHRGAAYLPWAFTEHGAIMAATIIKSPRAVATLTGQQALFERWFFCEAHPVITTASPASRSLKTAAPIPILRIRGEGVLIDADLARLYGVPTKRLNEQVKRNLERFPEDFLFQLTPNEKAKVVANCDHLRNLRFAKTLPYAFTEHGALMAANVLNSPEAVKMSVFVVRAFVKQREAIAANATILKRLAEIERTLLVHDTALRDVYEKLRPLLLPPPEPPKRRIGFHTEPE